MYGAYDTTMTAVMQVKPPVTIVVLPPSARDKRLQQSSNIESLEKGGAGESGFCYEPGASVAVTPVEALLTAPLATAVRRYNSACARKRTERRSGGAFPVAKAARARGASAEQQEAWERADVVAKEGSP